MFVECKFQNQVINCATSFREVVQHFGLCYTFNGLEYYRSNKENHDEQTSQTWNVDDGYNPTAPLATYPRRGLGAGKQFGLSILLRMNKRDIDFACSSEAGFRVKLFVCKFSSCVQSDSIF
jgi:Amiloride-sensitive sodium channel